MHTLMANMPLKFLALVLAILLWGVANTSSSIERGFDIPVVLRGVPQDLVVTGLSADQVNVRISGSRAQLRNFADPTSHVTFFDKRPFLPLKSNYNRHNRLNVT